MAKLVDASDLKSADRKVMPVRFRLRAPPNQASTPPQWANAPLVQQQPVESDAAIRLTSLRSRRLQAGMAESNAPAAEPRTRRSAMKWIGIASSLALVAMLAQATAPASAQSRSDSHRNLDGSLDIRNSDGSSSRIKRDLSGRVTAEHSNGSRSTTTTDLSGRKRTTHSDGSYSNSSTDLSGNIRTQYSDGSYSVSKRDLSGRWRTEYSDGSYSTSVRDLSGNWSTTSSGGMAARHPERGVGKR
jgi:YD repeat-containing protein